MASGRRGYPGWQGMPGGRALSNFGEQLFRGWLQPEPQMVPSDLPLFLDSPELRDPGSGPRQCPRGSLFQSRGEGERHRSLSEALQAGNEELRRWFKHTVGADLCWDFVPGQQIIAQVSRRRQRCLYGLLGRVSHLCAFYVSPKPRS